METEGVFAPETAEEANRRFDALETATQEVVREVTRTMSFDTAEYSDRVTPAVLESAREALFASLLKVRVGSRDEFDSWYEGRDGAVVELGHEAVDNAVWHAPPFADTVVVATFQNERTAAVGTLRQQAFARLYTDTLDTDPA